MITSNLARSFMVKGTGTYT